MTTQIAINVIHGNAEVTDADRERAEAAALKILGDTPVGAAFAEFTRQWEGFDDYGPMTGLAALWVRAEEGANTALTEGWADPSGASCGISA